MLDFIYHIMLYHKNILSHSSLVTENAGPNTPRYRKFWNMRMWQVSCSNVHACIRVKICTR